MVFTASPLFTKPTTNGYIFMDIYTVPDLSKLDENVGNTG
jgi:hypothetical protein